ncbi:nucleotidyltransferase family protein [Parvularcula flava]|uniref:Mannose-1-phosphate guanylyltransferase n=1 Tax=Aquisalinus luteolus TaxID=1566827 RepID=A0A8J3A423_9PROT|nr:nucleotidyltransferase family protein [Aquisalinus luteolus]NHK28280.1 nucleotidyltransferase family protein [Aquisalinus luteolus]GGH98006.1 mannose-1-phosphate guanylyltransferase [Aquisalinus luteolus]
MTRIHTAMVLAAGLGTRMRPLTDNCPKPLIPVAGKPLIDYVLDRFFAAGVEKAVVNVHYLAEQLEDHLDKRTVPRTIISDERAAPMETGGALIQAAPVLGTDPIYCTNTDAILLDSGEEEACSRLANGWRDDEMDVMLLLCPVEQASGYDGDGDFILDEEGRVHWPSHDPSAVKYVFTGLQVIHPRLFAEEALRKVSTRAFWDKAMAEGRMFGLIHDGPWMHVGDPEGLKQAEKRLAQGSNDERTVH